MSSDVGQFSAAVLAKADKLLATPQGLVPDPEFPNIWWVTPSGGGKRYRVQANYDPETRTLSWITCTCPHGMNKGAGATKCYHAAAVLILWQDTELSDRHSPVEGVGGYIECSCGWPTTADFREHTASWQPDFVLHLLTEKRRSDLSEK